MAEVDLSIGPPSAPQVAGGVGDAVPSDAKPKATRAKSTSKSESDTPAPTGLGMLDDPLPAVTMDQVKALVMGAGLMLGMAIGDDDVPEHWRFTDAELAALVPPLTAMINRRPALQRAVRRGDEFTIALVLAGYAGRNVDSLRAARKARSEREGEAEGGSQGEAPGAAGAAGAGADGNGLVGAAGAGGGVRSPTA